VVGGYTLVGRLPTRSSALAASAYAPTWALLEGSTPEDVIFLQLKQAASLGFGAVRARRLGRGTRIRVSGSWNTSRRCRPSATRLLGWTTIGELAVLRAVSSGI
jgi:hypothetical protein